MEIRTFCLIWLETAAQETVRVHVSRWWSNTYVGDSTYFIDTLWMHVHLDVRVSLPHPSGAADRVGTRVCLSLPSLSSYSLFFEPRDGDLWGLGRYKGEKGVK